MQPKPPKTPLSVSALTHAIKANLESSFSAVCVQGEISNFKRQSSGHLYFTLKDANAQISCAMFRGDAISLRAEPKSGDQVLLYGEINVYPPRGNYQIIVRRLEHAGLGLLLMQLEKLKSKLKSLGYFDQERKKALPEYPKKIGIITSPTGAAIQDMLHVLKRRASGFHVILYPVKVQGDGAKEEICDAIKMLNKLHFVDVIILGRGGGSIEDLWAFNEECVAEAIFTSHIPIISAVGHETDMTLADFVADVRAPTPSAAAEIVLGETNQKLQLLTEWQKRLDQLILPRLKEFQKRLQYLQQSSFLRSPRKFLEPYYQKLDDYAVNFDHILISNLKAKKITLQNVHLRLKSLSPEKKVYRHKETLEKLTKQLDQSMQSKIEKRQDKIKYLQTILTSLDPKNLLQKGYSILFAEKDHSVILSTQDLLPGDKVEVQLGKGRAKATINETFSS